MKNQRKKCGGGTSDLKTNLPIDLQYLYKNDYFDSVKLLFVLEHFNRRKKGIQIEEANYYFTLIDYLESDLDNVSINKQYFQNIYLNNEILLKKLVLRLVNSGYIKIEAEKMLSRTNLYLKLTEQGSQVIIGFEHPIYEVIKNKINLINKNYKYRIGINVEELLNEYGI